MISVPLALFAPASLAVAFLAVLLMGKRFPRQGTEIAVGVSALNAVVAGVIGWLWLAGSREPTAASIAWFRIGNTQVEAAMRIDGFAVVLCFLVGLVSLAVNVFSAAYMKDDRRRTHFFAFLLLFSSAMQLFVISDNTLQLVFAWEVMAICSFLLIGHWWEEQHNVAAAMKAFLTTRVSDVGLLLGVAVFFFAANNSFSVQALNSAATNGDISRGVLVTGAVALFIAVIGKSAQFPLHTWLPDAMAGPTPMSALIHAATMVVAGVFLVSRLFPVFDAAFSITDGNGGANLIIVVGSITIVIAALLAFLQRDIKKVLSYSTVSQLGYMVVALGAGAVLAGVFHLVIHAFAKSALFLAAGSISRSVHGYDLQRDMGGLRKDLPYTHAGFLLAALCLVGVIPFSAFWSKELIVSEMDHYNYGGFIWVVVLGSMMTATYMARMYYLAFWGERRGPKLVRESPFAMTLPTLGLTLCAALASFGVLVVERPQTHGTAMWAAVLIEAAFPVIGIVLAVVCFKLGIGAVWLARRFRFARAAYHVLWNRYYLDWVYERVIVRSVNRGLAMIVHWFDLRVVDALTDKVGQGAVKVGRGLMKGIESEIVDGTVDAAGEGAMSSGALLSRSQSGRLQRYMTVALVGLVVAVVALTWMMQ